MHCIGMPGGMLREVLAEIIQKNPTRISFVQNSEKYFINTGENFYGISDIVPGGNRAANS